MVNIQTKSYTLFISYIIIILILFSLLFLVSCTTNVSDNMIKLNDSSLLNSTMNITKFKYLTTDGFEIYGTIYFAETEKSKLLLLHGINQNQDDYISLAKYLNQKDITAITIDFRGHGKSVFRGKVEIHSTDLTLNDYDSFVSDIKGVAQYLDSKNMSHNFAIVGSDIGANVALNFAAKNNNTVNKVILISPSLNYYGITTKDALNNYNGELYIVTAVNDEISFEPSQYLYDNYNSTKKQLKLYVGSEHGISLFTKETGLAQSVADWLQ